MEIIHSDSVYMSLNMLEPGDVFKYNESPWEGIYVLTQSVVQEDEFECLYGARLGDGQIIGFDVEEKVVPMTAKLIVSEMVNPEITRTIKTKMSSLDKQVEDEE